MSSYGKKRRVNENKVEEADKPEEDSSEDEIENIDDEESDSDVEINEEVQIEFEALPPQPGDADGITRLLQQLFGKAHIDLGDLTKTILSQDHVGSVVKQSADQLAEDSDQDDDESEDDIFGFISVINITKKESPSTNQLKNWIFDKCKKCGTQSDNDQLNSVLEGGKHSVGFLITERFINIPPQLALPLHKSLQKDLGLASQKSPKFNFDYYLMISKTFKSPESSASSKTSKQGKESKDEIALFANAEDEYFHEESMLSFSFPVSEEGNLAVGGKWSGDDTELNVYRTVMLIPTTAIKPIIAKMEKTLAL
ncbi:BRCA2 and CDKN1A-interacting protein-like [Antedon mediterranea]|uniref:BRCA2 and CDKN1A-interacting protein-like n=1 Tax=Antedon mediterranea TaxID=105859 RepID=UPI003AF8E1C5